MDELMFAGQSHYLYNTSFYLYTSNSYWTMSPFSFDSYSGYETAYVSSSFINERKDTSNALELLPSISLSNSARVLKGTGEYNNPYIIEGTNNFNTITFTVDGTTYTALEGMTYYDWAISSYAPTEYNEYYSSANITSSYRFIDPESGHYFESQSTLCGVYALDVIVNGEQISLVNVPGIC